VCGKEDLLFPPVDSAAILQAIPALTEVVIEGAAHSIHMEQPEAFTECVSSFMVNG